MIFERSNFTVNQSSMGWDGTFRGKKADQDVYVYNVEIICINGQVIPYTGNVMLLR